MAKRDYYEVLGVGRDADEAELKKALDTFKNMFQPSSAD